MSDPASRLHRHLVSEAGRPPGLGALVEMVRRHDPLTPTGEAAATAAEVSSRLVGLGPIDGALADPQVTDVLVNGPGPVWVERSGVIAAVAHVGAGELALVIERILGPLGRRADPRNPVVDARLPDGSRVHVVAPPIAVDGPYLTIRRFSVTPLGLDAFAGASVAGLLRQAVLARANIVVSGPTGSGKTTLLNALVAELPPGERIVTVEDAAELRLPGPQVVRLESRPPSVDGAPAVTCGELVRSALRMRPDRLVVGEVRGSEALDLLQAMNTGHDGSLSTLHANGPADAVRRLESLVLMAGIGLPHAVVADHLAAAIDLLVHVSRLADGRRRVTAVAEPVAPSHRSSPADAVRVVVDGDTVVAEPGRLGACAARSGQQQGRPERALR